MVEEPQSAIGFEPWSKTVKRLLLTASLLMVLGACTPTIRVEVAPINIYAKLDADVRVKLDKEVQTAIQQNPDLF
jgi:hypothetical protein